MTEPEPVKPADSTDAAQETPEPPRFDLDALLKIVKALQTLVVSLGALAFATFVGVFIALELMRDGLRIEPIQSPPALADRGFSPVVLGQELLEGMLQIRDGALTAREKEQLAPGWQEIEIDVPGTNMSIESVIRFMKWYETRILGAVTEEDDGTLRLRLRTNGVRLPVPEDETIIAPDVDGLIDRGARAIMKATDPFIFAAYQYFREKDRPGACRTLRLVLSNDNAQDDPWAYNLRGLILDDYGLHAQAEEAYRTARNLDPKFAQPLNNLALSRMRRGDEDAKSLAEAEAMLEQAIRLDPEFPQARINLAVLQVRPLLDGAPDNPERKAIVSAAFRELDAAIALDPRSPHGYFTRGMMLRETGRAAEGVADLRRALDVRPGFAPAYVGLAANREAKGETDAAAVLLQRATELDGHLAAAWMAWGYLEIKTAGDAALAKIETAIALDPRLKTATVGKILDWMRQGGYRPRHLPRQPETVELDLFGCPTVRIADNAAEQARAKTPISGE